MINESIEQKETKQIVITTNSSDPNFEIQKDSYQQDQFGTNNKRGKPSQGSGNFKQGNYNFQGQNYKGKNFQGKNYQKNNKYHGYKSTYAHREEDPIYVKKLFINKKVPR